MALFGEVPHSGTSPALEPGQEAAVYSCLILCEEDTFEGLVTETDDSAPKVGVNWAFPLHSHLNKEQCDSAGIYAGMGSW